MLIFGLSRSQITAATDEYSNINAVLKYTRIRTVAHRPTTHRNNSIASSTDRRSGLSVCVLPVSLSLSYSLLLGTDSSGRRHGVSTNRGDDSKPAKRRWRQRSGNQSVSQMDSPHLVLSLQPASLRLAATCVVVYGEMRFFRSNCLSTHALNSVGTDWIVWSVPRRTFTTLSTLPLISEYTSRSCWASLYLDELRIVGSVDQLCRCHGDAVYAVESYLINVDINPIILQPIYVSIV